MVFTPGELDQLVDLFSLLFWFDFGFGALFGAGVVAALVDTSGNGEGGQ